MPDVPLDEARVVFLLELLRKRTQAEVTLGVWTRTLFHGGDAACAGTVSDGESRASS